MSDKTYLGRHWKILLNIVTLLALAVLVYAVRHDLTTTFRNLARVHAWALVLLLPIEF